MSDGENTFAPGAIVTLAVTDLNNLGCGVGHAPDGRTVFVQGAVAGDVVRAQIIKWGATFAVAKLQSVLSPSPDRADDFCAAPASCGGCVYRFLTYEKELALKKEALRHTFRKAGLPEVVIEDVCTVGACVGYRNKAQYPIAENKNGLYGGFYAQKTHRVVPCGENCQLQPPLFGEILRATCAFFSSCGVHAYDEQTGKGLLRHLYVREGRGTGEVMVCLVVNGERLPREAEYVKMLRETFPAVTSVLLNVQQKNTNVVLGERYRTLWGKSYITDTLCGLSFNIAPDAFYQVNHDAAELLYHIAAERAELTGNELLLDLYCGAGTIGLSMAHRAREIIGIEIVPAAVENAKENMRRNGVQNAHFYCGDAADISHLLAGAEQDRGTLYPDVVILDPPRKGCTKELLDFLIARRAPRIVYVSCGPDSLARDAAYLAANGYRLGAVTPVDLFPRTGHVESVLCLSRK